jgi:Sporulation and spore germination
MECSISARNSERPLDHTKMIPRHFYIAASVMLAAALGMSLYAWRMRGRAAAAPATSADTRPVVAPVAGPTEQVTLYVAYDDLGILRAQAARIPLPSVRQQRAEELLRALIVLYLDKTSPHPLPAGSDIRSVYLVDPGLAVIDVNAAFADGHRSGVLTEDLTVTSLIQTLSANIPGIAKVKILVEGKQRDTLAGHVDLSNFFGVSAINQLASQLQSMQ